MSRGIVYRIGIEGQRMTRIPSFDEASMDSVIDQIRETRAYIKTLPHRGRLIDIDTLLAVAEAEAQRLTVDLTVQQFTGTSEVAAPTPAGQDTHFSSDTATPRLM